MASTRTGSRIIFTEQGNGPGGPGLLEGHDLRLSGIIRANPSVDPLLDAVKLLLSDTFEMGEVEPQSVGCHQGTLLHDVLTQNLPQCRVQQMRRGMISCRGGANAWIDSCLYLLADAEVAIGQNAEMHHCVALALGVGDLESQAVRLDHTLITHLTTGFGIKRRPVQDHHTVVFCLQGFNGFTLAQERDNFASTAQRIVTDELGLTVDGQGMFGHGLELTRSAGPFALRFHLRIEGFHVNLETPFARDIGSQVGGKTVGIIEPKHRFPGYGLTIQPGDRLIKMRVPWSSVSANRSSSCCNTRSTISRRCESSGYAFPISVSSGSTMR